MSPGTNATGWHAAQRGCAGHRRLPDRASILQFLAVCLVAGVLGMGVVGAGSIPQQWVPLFLAAMLGPFVAMIVGDVRRVLLAIIVLDIPFQIDVYFAYRPEVEALGATVGYNVSPMTVSLVVLYVLWLTEVLVQGKRGEQPAPQVGAVPVLYLGIVGLSLLVAGDRTLALFELFLLVQLVLLHVYVASWIRTREDLLFIVAMLFVALLLEALFMVGAPFLGGGFGFLGGSGGVGTTDGQRLTGTFGSPNYAGSFLALALAPALGVLFSSAAPRYKQLAILAVAAGSVALLLTFSRGGWIAFGLAVGILCALTWQRGWMPLPFPLAAIALVLVAGLVSGDVVLARLVGTDAGSAESRVPLMRIAWRMIEDHKALGVGANNFTENIAQYTTPEFRNEWLYTVHNKYLLVWAETGTAGLAAFLLLLAGTLRRGWACWRLGDRLLSPVALGLTAATVGLISHMLVEVFSGRSLALFWLFAGLISAIDGMPAREASLLYPAPSSIPVQESSTTKISTTTD